MRARGPAVFLATSAEIEMNRPCLSQLFDCLPNEFGGRSYYLSLGIVLWKQIMNWNR